MNESESMRPERMTPWFETAYRKLFFDFHSPADTVGLACAFDAEAWADRLAAAGAQAASIFVKSGNGGYSYYRKGSVRFVHPELPEGLDMVESQIAAFHRRGLRAIGYYHLFGSEPLARLHPECRVRMKSDAPPATDDDSVCFSGRMLDEHILPQIEEILIHYDLDGLWFDGAYFYRMCYCDDCRRKYRDATGREMPSEPKGPDWPRYAAWAFTRYDEIREAIAGVVRRLRPDLYYAFNKPFVPKSPGIPPESLPVLTSDVEPQDQVLGSSYHLRYMTPMGKCADIMPTVFLRWWMHWDCKPAIAMQQEAAAIIANGGTVFLGYQMDPSYQIRQPILDAMGEALAFIRAREPLLPGARPVPYIAALHASDTYLASHREGHEGWAGILDGVPSMGLHKALVESGFHYSFEHEVNLEQRLFQYKAVILNDQRRLPPSLVRKLRPFVEQGGVLVVTHLTGTLSADYMPTGAFDLEEILGVRLIAEYDQSHAYMEATHPALLDGMMKMPHQHDAKVTFVQPLSDDVETWAKLYRIYLRTGGKPYLIGSSVGEDSGHPAVTVRRVGKGAAAYIAGDIFRAYHAQNQWPFKVLVRNLLNTLITDKPVEVDAVPWLEVTLNRQDLKTIVHLVNHHGSRPIHGMNYCLEEIHPVHSVTVRLACPQRPGCVKLEPGGAIPEWSHAHGVLTVQIPRVDLHIAVTVE